VLPGLKNVRKYEKKKKKKRRKYNGMQGGRK
jgi:hypothetical protein